MPIAVSNTVSRNLDRSELSDSGVGFVVLDMSDLNRYFDELRELGVKSFRDYASDKPSLADICFDRVHTVDANHAFVQILGGRSKEEMIGYTRLRPLPGTSQQIDALESLYSYNCQFDGTWEVEGITGRRLILMLGAVPNVEGTPQEDRVLFSVIDVTEHERTKKQLSAAENALAKANRVGVIGTLSASIAHELNQPMTALRMDSQAAERWLLREKPETEEAIASIRRIIASSSRITDIVQGVRNTVLHEHSNIESFDVLELVKEVASLLERDIMLSRAQIRVSSTAQRTLVHADKGEIRQVLVNLIVNGLQAMTQLSGQTPCLIVISVQNPSAGEVLISVRDHGPGIAISDLERMFDTFFTTKREGMGIGLSICRSIVERHNGQIYARNHPAGGAIVEFVLPIKIDEAAFTKT